MANKGVAIRLGTEGKAQVKSDFGEVRKAGEDAFKGIGDSAKRTTDANEAQFRRLASGYDKAVAEMEAADRRRAATADKLNAMVPKTALQGTIDHAASMGGVRMSQAGGYDLQAKSARDSAAAIRELLAAEDAHIAKAAAIRAILDPLAAAQDRYNRELAETQALHVAGKISAQELAQYQLLLKQRLEESTAANDNATKMIGSYRAGLQNVGFQVSDFFVQIGAGTDAVRAFSLQAPQAVQALAMMGHGADASKSKFAAFTAFLQTGWGAAITVGVSLIGVLASVLSKSGDAADDSARSQRTLADVLSDTSSSYREVIQALNDYNGAKERELDTTSRALIAQRDLIDGNYQEAISVREKIKAQLEYFETLLNDPYSMREGSATLGIAVATKTAAGQLEEQQKKVDELKLSLANTRADIAGIVSDPEQKIRDRYQLLRRDAALAIDDQDKLNKKYAELRQQETKALEAIRQTNKAVSASSQASLGDMTALIEQLFPGARITSTTGGKHTKGSDHYAGRAIDFVIPGMMNAEGTKRVGETLETAGVDIRRNAKGTEQFFGPGRPAARAGDHDDHFHVAWQGRTSPEKAADTIERAMLEEERRRQAYESALASLQSDELDARKSLITNSDDLYALERAQIDVERQKYNNNVFSLVTQKKLTQEEADQLLMASNNTASLKQQAIYRQFRAEKIGAAGELDDLQRDNQIDLLQHQEGFARTAAERREIALTILDLERQQARAEFDRIQKLHELGQVDDDTLKAARLRLRHFEAIAGFQTDGILRDTAGPLESYAADLDQTKAQIYERAEGWAVAELDHFRRGMNDAITEKLGIKDPFLASLIDLFIEQWLIKPIAESMARASQGGGGGGIGGVIAGLVGAIGGAIAGGGSSSVANNGGMNLSGAIVNIPGAAVGTEYSSGGYTWLAENGPELVNLPRGSKVTPAAETRRILGASNDNRPIVLQQFDYSNAVMTEDLMREMDARSQAAAVQATEAGISQLIDQNRRSYGRVLSATG